MHAHDTFTSRYIFMEKNGPLWKVWRYGERPYSHLITETVVHQGRIPKYRRIFHRPLKGDKRVGAAKFRKQLCDPRTSKAHLRKPRNKSLNIVLYRLFILSSIISYKSRFRHSILSCVQYERSRIQILAPRNERGFAEYKLTFIELIINILNGD